MGDKAGSDDFLALASIVAVVAFWGVWRGKDATVFTMIVVGVAYTLFSAAKFTWGLG